MVFLSPTNDLVFKKLFGTPANKKLVIDFLNNVLEKKEGERIVDVIFDDPNNHLKGFDLKFSIVDVRCTDQTGSQYIVEMQNQHQKDYALRAQYYGACGLTMQLEAKNPYKKLVPVIFIGIVDFKLITRHDRYVSHYYFADSKDGQRDLNLLEYHFVDLKKFDKKLEELKTDVDRWIYFLKNATNFDIVPKNLDKSETISEAFGVLERSGWKKDDLLLYEKIIDAKRVERSVYETGIEKGRTEERIQVALKMLKKGIDIQTINETTGLTAEEIERLKR